MTPVPGQVRSGQKPLRVPWPTWPLSPAGSSCAQGTIWDTTWGAVQDCLRALRKAGARILAGETSCCYPLPSLLPVCSCMFVCVSAGSRCDLRKMNHISELQREPPNQIPDQKDGILKRQSSTPKHLFILGDNKCTIQGQERSIRKVGPMLVCTSSGSSTYS